MTKKRQVTWLMTMGLWYLMILPLSAQDKENLNKQTFKVLYDQLNKVKLKKTEKGWVKRGEVSIAFNQSTFDNWVQGGQNSVSTDTSLKYFITYNDNNRTWDNRIWLAYGFTSLQSDLFEKKTRDIIDFNSVYGLQVSKDFYISTFVNFRTQFTKGYKYARVNNVNTRTENSGFMSPGSFKIGVGALWKKSNQFKVNTSPLTADIIFVDSKYTLPEGKYYGVAEGDSVRIELGANVEAYSRLDLVENVSVEQILNLYANYLENFGDVDIYYRMTMIMKVNKFLSANFNFDALYNDNASSNLQTRQVLGVGINYQF